MAAIGDCQTVASKQPFVDVDEVSTVASMFALAPYFNPNYSTLTVNGASTLEPGDMLGTSTSYMTDYGAAVQGGYTTTGSKKSSATTPVGYTALANAFATVPELETLANGTAVQSFTRSGAVAGGTVTVTGTPEYAKLNLLADILTACVYTSSTGSTPSANCNTLFANAHPPINAYTTSLATTTTFPTATDTLQAAYYMAVNPTDNTVNGAATTGTTTNLGQLYALASAQPDFQPILAYQPTDWTLSIAYTSPSTCGTDSTTGPAISTVPLYLQSDLQGNVVIMNGTANASTTSTLAGFSPNMTPQFCQFGNAADPGTTPTVDLSGNIWVGSAAKMGIYQSTRSGSPIFWSGTVAGTMHQSCCVNADSLGNVNFLTEDDNNIYQFTGASFTTTPATAIDIYTDSSATIYPDYLAAAPSGGIAAAVYDSNATSPGVQESVPSTGNTYNTYNSTSSTVPFASAVAFDTANRFVVVNYCCNSVIAPTQSNTIVQVNPLSYPVTFTTSAAHVGGVSTSGSMIVDGAGNYWFTNEASTGKINGKSAWAVDEVDQNLNGLSPNGTTGGYQKQALAGGYSFAIDISGNVWVPSQGLNGPGGNITEFIGAAVPVINPVSIAARDNKIATKP
jgi:hypothetical protein